MFRRVLARSRSLVRHAGAETAALAPNAGSPASPPAQTTGPAPFGVRSNAQTSSVARPAPAHAGILVVGSSGAPLYANAEALRILWFPETLQPAALEQTLRSKALSREISARLTASNPRFRAERSTHLISGRRQYSCRHIAIRLEGERQTVVLIERAASESPALPSLCNGHRLTGREREMVALLAQGFTNKEIALRMAVSVNTVKAFIRCVMLKTGVSTRAGIVGRLFSESTPPRTD